MSREDGRDLNRAGGPFAVCVIIRAFPAIRSRSRDLSRDLSILSDRRGYTREDLLVPTTTSPK
jgi:hypothetical protein